MKYRPITILALVFATASASAATFDFSYLFGDGVTTASGVLSGTQVGDSSTGFVTDLTVLSLTFDGHLIGGDGPDGTLFSSKYDNSVGMVANAVVSYDATKLNFMFSTMDLANGVYVSGNPAVGTFYIFNYTLASTPGSPPIFDSGGYAIPTGNINSDVPGTWVLTNRDHTGASVPEGGTTLSLLGSVLMGAMVFHRKLLHRQ